MLTKLTQRIKDEEEKVEREFNAAWEQLAPDGGERLLELAAALATELEAAAKSTRQPACADARTLHADALAAAPELLRTMRAFVEDAGGVFEMPPPIGEVARGAPFADDADTLERVVKSLERVVEKADSDYAGDHTRVIDLVRATGRFDTPARLADALEMLLDPPSDSDAPAMRIVRCKDKFNNPRDGCVMRAVVGMRTRNAVRRASACCDSQVPRYDCECDVRRVGPHWRATAAPRCDLQTQARGTRELRHLARSQPRARRCPCCNISNS